MMRFLRGLLAVLGVLVITLFAVANRTPVEISFWPTPMVIDLPLYGVFLLGFVLGCLLGAGILSLDLLRLRIENHRLRRRLHGYEYQRRLREEAEEEAALRRAAPAESRAVAPALR